MHAISSGTVTLASIEGDGWSATGISLMVDLQQEPIKANAHIDRLQIVALGTQGDRLLRDLNVECGRVEIKGVLVACNHARILGTIPSIGKQLLSGNITFNRQTHALAFNLLGLKLAKGTGQLTGDWRDESWSARLQLHDGNIANLHTLLKSWVPSVSTISAAGHLDVDVSLQGRGGNLNGVEWNLKVRQLTAGNSEGSIASDGLDLDSHGSAIKIPNPQTKTDATSAWRFTVSVNSANGQAYAEPIFLNFKPNPIAISAEGEWLDGGRIALRQFSVEHDKVLSASGNGTVVYGDALQLDRLHVDIRNAQLPGAYASYVQPFLLNSAMGSLTTLGSVSGSVDVAANAPTMLSLEIHDTSATDTKHRWSVGELSGAIRWRKDRNGATPQTSALQWQSAQLLGIDIGAAKVHFVTTDRDFAIVAAAQIPVLDGSIELAELQVERTGLEDMTLQMDATLRPISVERLCAAFGWPLFGGRIGGRLANLQLHNGVMTLGTVLKAEVFDGRVSIADLRLEQPFGNWPRFSADIAIDNVDLAPVTSAFSFGLITGRLSGTIDNLRLFNWSPVSFDASLYTPKNDRSRHRISQRAVKNIGNMGGSGSGVAAALSSGFLRFFENFNYERLGIRCKLENDICAMNGVEPAKTGYYLVKGRGIPRIDVIGNASRVDWPRLVKQLQAATQSSGPQTGQPQTEPQKK